MGLLDRFKKAAGMGSGQGPDASAKAVKRKYQPVLRLLDDERVRVQNLHVEGGRLYLKGAAMQEMYPISTLPPSNLLNITLFSYAGQLSFGLIATDELPGLPGLGDYIQQAFSELEDAVRDARAA